MRKLSICTAALCAACLLLAPAALAYNTSPPDSLVKLVFVHHSTGQMWLQDDHGGLGQALASNNYYVSDTNYGWGPDGIGDLTDIGHWWDWFRGENRDTYLAELYALSYENSAYSRPWSDPGGENTVIMFKSCYPNSFLGGSGSDAATTGDNPLRGNDAYSEYMTVANAKGIYNDILEYFATRTDKLFVVITAPPQAADETDDAHAANARAFNNWLVTEWLVGYPHKNVAVFDFYNVLTSNGGDSNTNDAGAADGNHHRANNDAVEHLVGHAQNTSAYPTDQWDSHPTAAGDQKATAEFAPLLNVYYHCWQGSGGCPGFGQGGW